MKYKILCRYQHRVKTGMEWTKWYDYIIGLNSETEADNKLKELKETPSVEKVVEYKIEKGAL